MSEAIFVEGLTKKYGEKTVVNHLKGYIPDWQWMENYIKGLPYSDRI